MSRDEAGNLVMEAGRAGQHDDSAYWQRLAYVFELRRPGYPPVVRTLLLGPASYRIRRQFTQDIQIGLDGGVHVAEYGVILAQITLAVEHGTAVRGVRPDPRSPAVEQLSGLKRYRLILDDVLDPYSEAKRNPALAIGTTLILHVLKDSESWVVVPASDELRRDRAQPASHGHSIDLIAVGSLKGQLPPVAPDQQSLLEMITAPAQFLRQAVQSATACVDEITSYMYDAKLAAQSYLGVLDDVGALCAAVDAFLAGADTLIRLPRTAVLRLLTTLDAAIDTAAALGTEHQALKSWWTELEDKVEMIGAFPEQFQEALEDPVAARRQAQQGIAGYSAAELSRADGTPAGTGARPADNTRLAGGAASSASSPVYSGWTEVTVKATDTPAGIEARYGAPWGDIAAANHLQPPYFADVDLPGVVALGDKIRVPQPLGSTKRAPSSAALAEDELYGIDVLADPDEGYALDSTHGYADVATISGPDLVQQALRRRVQTHAGDNLIFPDDGLPFDVGSPNTLDAAALARVATEQAILSDPRIAKVEGLRLTLTEDRVEILDVRVDLADSSTLRARSAQP